LELDPVTDAAVLDSCFVTADSLEALRVGDYQRFLESRMQRLISLERAFMMVKGVVPYASDVPEVSAIDVEDSVPLSEAVSVTDLPEWEAHGH